MGRPRLWTIIHIYDEATSLMTGERREKDTGLVPTKIFNALSGAGLSVHQEVSR